MAFTRFFPVSTLSRLPSCERFGPLGKAPDGIYASAA
jgi:hypothetical protein